MTLRAAVGLHVAVQWPTWPTGCGPSSRRAARRRDPVPPLMCRLSSHYLTQMPHALTIRLDDETWRAVVEFSDQSGSNKVDAVRELLRIGLRRAPAVEARERRDAVATTASVADMQESIDQLVSALAHIEDSYGKVWVEVLMAARLLLDAHHRGLVDRAREMTTTYLERNELL
jgi:hypothetical protein